MAKEQGRRPIALVTGGTSGIGLAIVGDLARDHQVYAIGRRRAETAPLAGHPNVISVSLDLRDGAAVAAWVATLPRLDTLVHSAAVARPFSIATATPEIWRQHFDINLFGPAELTRLTLPALRASQGRIIFINSGSGTRPQAGNSVYSASKFALHALAEALRNEERAHGVRVATLYPGPTDTPMNRPEDGDDPLARSSPHSVARAVRLVIDTDEDSQITEIVVRPRRDPAGR